MKFESHATPYGGTPQHRYATLHRALEKGIDSDDVLVDLAKVCATLNHRSEAFRCMKRIRNANARAVVEQVLTQHFGSARREAPQEAAESPSPAAPLDGPSRRRDHRAAPAASNAGPAAQANEQEAAAPSVGEHLLDAAQYLLHQQMPWLVLTTMLAFPLVVGVGGFLTAGGSPLLLAAIAALPGLSVLAVVAAMGHRILTASANGEGDVPNLPELRQLIRDARRFAADGLLVTVAFFGVPAGLLFAGAPLPGTIAMIAVGAFFAPLAFSLRQLRGDMRALAPSVLLRAARACGTGYVTIATVTSLSFGPAAGVALLTMGSPVWVQIALVGPLCVLPVFATSRLLGSWMDTRREQLGYLTKNREQMVRGTGEKALTNRRPQSAASQRRMPKKPAALERFKPPVVDNRTAAFAPGTAATKSASQARPARRTPRSIEGRRPSTQPPTPAKQPTKAGSARAAKPSKPTPAPTTAKELAHASKATVGINDAPDLGSLPGAVFVSGADRKRQGAASRRP